MVLGRAAWTAARATARRAAGVTAAAAAWSISAGCSGWMRIRGRWPSRTPRVGSRKILPVFLAWPNSDRRAVRGRRELGPGDPVSGLAPGEHDGQRAAGLGDDPVVPAAGAGQAGGDVPGLLQVRAGDRRGGPVALVEVQRFAWRAQLQLGP